MQEVWLQGNDYVNRDSYSYKNPPKKSMKTRGNKSVLDSGVEDKGKVKAGLYSKLKWREKVVCEWVNIKV